MSDLIVERIRTSNYDGDLVTSGVVWNEARPRLVANYVLASLASVGLLVAVGFYNWATKGLAPSNWDLATPALIGMVVCPAAAFLFRQRRRAVIFHADGRTETPYGLPEFETHMAIGGSNADLTSIEAKRIETLDPNWRQLNRVMMISGEGDTIVVSVDLSDAAALKVAVQLTQALGVLRNSRAAQA